MSFENIEHHTFGNFCYPINDDDLVINLKTGYDIKRVFIIYNDPFSNGILGGKNEDRNDIKEEVFYTKNLANQVWWTTTIKPSYKRLKYYFELHSNDEVRYLLEDGLLTKEQLNNIERSKQCFIMPWLNKADVNYTPSWVNETIWYQIFPDRFNNGHFNNPPYVKEWSNRAPITKYHEVYGGDLQGIIDKMDYLVELGITGLYLTPIFKANSNHKYDTIDYMQIDPYFGNKEILKALVELCHKNNIRIMLDGVFNHMSSEHPFWLDILANGQQSKYFDWYMINKWPLDKEAEDTRNGDFFSFAFSKHMPKLNTNNPQVNEYLLNVCEYWVKEFDIDGMRLDVANEISHKFNKALRVKMDQIKPDFYILGEIWHEALSWLMGDEFHSVMNYPLTSAINDFFVDQKLDKLDFEKSINRCFCMYMQQTNDVLFNLLDSHDTPRVFNNVHGNINVFYQQLAILFTMPGSPCIYYGTEIAINGSYDPDCRRCMPWLAIDYHKYDNEINVMKALIKMRKENYVTRSRNFHFPSNIKNKRVIEYLKIDYDKKIEVIINASDEDIKLNEGKEILFKHLYKDNILLKEGVLIRYV